MRPIASSITLKIFIEIILVFSLLCLVFYFVIFKYKLPIFIFYIVFFLGYILANFKNIKIIQLIQRFFIANNFYIALFATKPLYNGKINILLVLGLVCLNGIFSRYFVRWLSSKF